jgi:hypothetical protein
LFDERTQRKRRSKLPVVSVNLKSHKPVEC